VAASAPGQRSGRGQQIPWWPATSQDTQFPLQAVLQQTPSAQKPEAQSVFRVHRAPELTWQRPVGSQ
jgi:hypothetical protein